MIRGVHIKKAYVIAEDERRKIVSILNGEIGVRDIHLLEMKKGGSILGQHKHWYAEVCFVYKGSCHYWLKNKEGETMEVDLKEGDIMYRAPEVVHTCTCTDDCVLIDGACESWIGEEWNHVREELVNMGGIDKKAGDICLHCSEKHSTSECKKNALQEVLNTYKVPESHLDCGRCK